MYSTNTVMELPTFAIFEAIEHSTLILCKKKVLIANNVK